MKILDFVIDSHSLLNFYNKSVDQVLLFSWKQFSIKLRERSFFMELYEYIHLDQFYLYLALFLSAHVYQEYHLN